YENNYSLTYVSGMRKQYTDRVARLWDAATGKGVGMLKGHRSRITTAAFSPDGRRLVTASWDQTARVWDVATLKELAVLQHESSLLSAAFSADGRRVLTVSSGYLSTWSYPDEKGDNSKIEIDPQEISPITKDVVGYGSGGSGGSSYNFGDRVLARV